MSRVKLTFALTRALVLGCAVLAASNSMAFAQGRGGGGGRGGRGGGRGAGGGGGVGMSVTAMDRIREELKETDELQFLESRTKQLSLDKEQKEKVKSLNKEMDQMQKPIFKEMEKTFADAERGGSQGGDRGGEETGGRGGRGGMPAGIRESMGKLTDIQAAYADRALVILNDNQKHMADSLRLIYKDELRDKAARKTRSRGFGGRGN